MNIRVVTVMISILLLAACSKTTSVDQLELEYNKEVESIEKLYTREIETLVEEHQVQVSIMQEKLDQLEKEVIELSTDIQESETLELPSVDEQKLLDLYQSESFIMYRGETNSRVKVRVNLLEPLRILPSIMAPFYLNRLTYNTHELNGDAFAVKEVTGELLYSVFDPVDISKKWCLIIAENMIGYVPEENIIEYINVESNFETKEFFNGLELGITVNELEQLYPDSYEHVSNKMEFFQFVKIVKNGSSYLTAEYNPNTRIIDSICVSTEEIPLASGFRVGDDVIDVFSYYDPLYENIDIYENAGVNDSENYRFYDLGDGYYLYIESKEGVVWFISISPRFPIMF